MIERRPIIISQWASQAGRRRAALEPDYVGIDERTLPELLAFAPSFARHVRYFDLEDREDGDWSVFFMADSAMILASIAMFDGAARSRRFRKACQDLHLENADALRFEQLKKLFNTIVSLAAEVEAWHTAAIRLTDSTGAGLRALLTSVISRELAPLLGRLRAYGFGAGQPGALGLSIPVRCHHFHPIWRNRDMCPDGSIYRGHFRRQKIGAAIGPLTTLYDALLGAVSDLADRARHDLESVLANGRHKPHIALYIAFIKKFQVAQERLNELPSRVVDFYYRELLREPLRAAIPDRMFLSFTRTPGTGAVNVSRGTQFPAGTDVAGRPIVFAADRTLNVTQARLMRARATRTIRGPLWDGMTNDSPRSSAQHLRFIRTNEVLIGPNGAFAEGRPWAPFSAPAAGTINEKGAQAPLGFAIRSRCLLLAGGHRGLTVSVRSSAEFQQTTLGPLLQQITNATGLTPDLTLSQIANAAFRFSITTATGWYEIAPCNITASAGEENGSTLSFHFEVPADAPAFAALELQPTGERSENAIAAPTLLARLNQSPVTLSGSIGSVTIYPLSLLEGLPIEDAVIETRVSGLSNVNIQTRGGPIDATTSFLPFGTPARAGAWFDIHHRELFAKPLDQLTVSINWLALPAHPRGFAGHYEQYRVGPDRQIELPPITNDSFRIAPTLVGDAPWTLAADSAPLCLFRTKGATDETSPSGPLDPTTVITLSARSRTDQTSPDSSHAALRFTLTDPSFGFGDELYSPNVLYALNPTSVPPPPRRRLLCRLVDCLFGRKAATPTPIPPDVAARYPNPPWQPEIASISLAYTSTVHLDTRSAQGQQFLHLLPSGALAPAMRGKNGTVLLLPQFVEHAQLDLGFTGLGVAQILTLLFRVTAEGNAADYSGALKWRARGVDGWTTLGADAVRHDSSDGLRHSGIVSLDLPSMAADASRERLYWIRAVPMHDPDNFPSIVAITPHALTATRIANSNAGPSPAIPPKTVKAAALALTGVATIDQPVASFGGLAAESPETLPTRLGERLRHKDRAILAWDYERLVLQRFPEILKLRILPARNVAKSHKPGELLIVVMPGPSDIYATDLLTPRTSVDTRGRIQASLQAAASPFAQLHVVDPTYVRVAVQAEVIFRADEPGHGPTVLTDDLCEFLAPWSGGLTLPDHAGPGDIRTAIANFIATRNYVASLVSLELQFDAALEGLDWCVLTSAINHDIRTAVPARLATRQKSRAPVASEEYVYGL